jgi:2-keto-4-pentenoate hydratase/2-oxohepta-3-ene-1,7-dioic acid hydratase in catechol pathway
VAAPIELRTVQTMRDLTLLNFVRGGRPCLGVKLVGGILDVQAAGRSLGVPVPATTDEAVQRLHSEGLRAAIAAGGPLLEEASLTFAPAIVAPEKILMLGFNYRRHAAETGAPIPSTPVLFNKFANALCGHGATVRLPTRAAEKFDYEVELVIVMGAAARDVSEADALAHVAGYCTGNDLSARDLQFRTSQFMLGKISDGFAPLGPYLVGADLVGDPQRLSLSCEVNGEPRQSSSTSDMIFGCAQIVSYVSRILTLRPGDLIFTGTPEGVIAGMPPERQRWLRPGDRVRCRVERLGELAFALE